MNEGEWLPIYRDVLSDMGYRESSDAESGWLLDSLAGALDLCDEGEARGWFAPHVVVVGGHSTLPETIPKGIPVVSAGSATGPLVDAGIMPDVVVTDLDADIGAQLEASSWGALTFMHAHGDNMHLLREYALSFKGKVIPTVQGVSHGRLRNYGGFTDGDRAVCVSEHFGASRVTLAGFDFDNPVPNTPTKAKKLAWARKIIGMRVAAGLSVDVITTR